MDTRQPHLVYEFGEFRLDALRRVITSRTDEALLPLTGRAFDALLHFVERPGELLEKRAIMEALWPRVVVEDSSLTQLIHTLRRTLGERPDDHRYIVTVPGRGYRFVADVNVQAIESPRVPDPPVGTSPVLHGRARVRGRNIVVAALGVLLAIGGAAFIWSMDHPRAPVDRAKPAIAVLPFADLSPAHDQEYFSDGLAEEILNELAQSTAVRVIARTSSFSFRNQDADIETIAERLAVTHVLEGSVRRSGDRIRITAQLVDGATSEHLWSRIYDRETRDVFGVQTEIATAVADALHVTLTGHARPVRTAQAFEHYLKGRYFMNRRGPDDLERARQSFEEAVKFDPTYASAWVGLAGVHNVATDGRAISQDEFLSWREAVGRSLALRPDSAEAQVRAAQFYWNLGDVGAADTHFERAMTLDSSDPLVLGMGAGIAVSEGRLQDAISLQRRAVQIDPVSPVARNNLAAFLVGAGEWDTAQHELESALALSAGFSNAQIDLARLLIAQRRFSEALEIVLGLPAGGPRDQCLALIYGATGDEEAREDALSRLIEHAKHDDADGRVSLSVAEVLAFGGETDRAFDWLARTRKVGLNRNLPGPSCRSMVEMQLSPFLTPLQRDPRWQSLLVRAHPTVRQRPDPSTGSIDLSARRRSHSM